MSGALLLMLKGISIHPLKRLPVYMSANHFPLLLHVRVRSKPCLPTHICLEAKMVQRLTLLCAVMNNCAKLSLLHHKIMYCVSLQVDVSSNWRLIVFLPPHVQAGESRYASCWIWHLVKRSSPFYLSSHMMKIVTLLPLAS